ncbi:MAG: type II secretion system F family protein [Candidatus Omnitrophota bacterium]
MPTYRYKVRDRAGKLTSGVIDALSENELVDKLRKMGYIVTSVTVAGWRISFEDIAAGVRRVAPEEMIFLNIQLSNMLEAGLPLLKCLKIISEQTENKKLRKIMEDVSLKVETGASFSEALSSESRYFSRLAVSMIRSGEASGNLPLSLKRLADFGEKELELRQRVSSALLYPAVLTVAATCVTLFIVTFIIPKFAEIFYKAGISLPLITRVLNSVGLSIRDYWHLFILGVIISLFGMDIYKNTRRGRLKLDEIKLNFPVIGSLIRRTAISRFARALATLSASGVSILESLEILEVAIGNQVLSRVVANVREAVRGGSKIFEPLKMSGEFPPDAVQMIAAGEETGNLDGMLNKVADLYDSAVSYSIKRLTSLLEPFFLVVMGCVVAVIMGSILVPMFDLIKALKR